jgi:hypothetical protein
VGKVRDGRWPGPANDRDEKNAHFIVRQHNRLVTIDAKGLTDDSALDAVQKHETSYNASGKDSQPELLGIVSAKQKVTQKS